MNVFFGLFSDFVICVDLFGDTFYDKLFFPVFPNFIPNWIAAVIVGNARKDGW
jgi:hypothetical protein